MLRCVAVAVGVLVTGCGVGFALNSSLDISQYSHTAWTVRSGFIKGNIYTITQTPDGYLWLGSEFGILRFDGVRTIAWQPPAGQHLPGPVFRLLGARDGTLWVGTFNGLATWSGGKLTRRPELDGQVVGSLMEDREGTIWAGSWQGGPPPGRLCAIRGNSTKCYGEDAAFGNAVSSLYEDRSGTIWAGAATGLWRLNPGPLMRYATRPMELTGVAEAGDGRLVIATYGSGLLQLAGNKVVAYPIARGIDPRKPLPDREVNANKLLRDRDGGLWIGTVERGLIHIHQGRTDVFTRSDGLSGDIVLSLFEDREGNIWVATTGGLDRFRELPVTTISVKQGLSSDATESVLAAADGSVWIATHDGLTRWQDGQFAVFRKTNGLPDDAPQSLFQDDRGRIWVSTVHGLAYFQDGRFVPVNAPGEGEAYSIAGDKSGNLWLSEHRGLLRVREGRLVETFPWPEMGRHQQAKAVLSDGGGLWLSFWSEGGVLYFKDGQRRALYAPADGLGEGTVPDLRLDRDGALWAATSEGGISRLKDGRIATLSTRNGLPCDTIHWSIEAEDGSMWLWTACGLVHIAKSELDGWVAGLKRTIRTTVWDAADGVRLRSGAATGFRPPAARSSDGKLWFVTGEGVQVADLRHPPVNRIPPAVHIEQVRVNGKPYGLKPGMRLPASARDISIEYTALSLVAPEKVRFKYRLEGQDEDWQEKINDRQAEYTNLAPRHYRFRVIACNNSGVWNETGDSLEFSLDPAYYQTLWFGALCASAFLSLLWAAYQFRDRRLQRLYNMRLDERLEERTRIARELHDTLLQSFQGSLYLFQAARNLFSRRPEEALNTLDSAISSAEDALAEGRNAIQNLRVRSAESRLEDLLTAAGKELRDAQNGNTPSPMFQVSVEGQPRTLSPLLQDEIYRIAREVLRNAFQHSGARRIEAGIQYDPDLLRLRIRDDGKGIDPKVLQEGARPGHWGLPGIRERARHIGAQLKIWSETGAGAEVELTVPARIAYSTAPPRRGFQLFRKRKAGA